MRIYQFILRLLRRRRFWLVSGIPVLALALLVAFLPWIIANTSLRNVLLANALPHPDMRASIGRAELGWFSPLRLEQLEIVRDNGQFRFDVANLESSRSWFQNWWGLPDLDRVKIDRPTIEVVVPQSFNVSDTPNDKTQTASAREGLTLEAIVNGANIIIRTPELNDPIVDLKDLDLVMRIQRRAEGRDLIIDAVQVFDRHELTPELCNHGLQLVAPILARAASIEGAVSFKLDEFRVPLDSNVANESQAKVSGVVQLHNVTTSAKGPILQKVVKFMEGVFRIDIPDKLQVADGTDVHFRLQDGRVHHEGLAFLLPEISSDVVFKTSGSVGLDETLDLYVDVPLPATLIRDGPIARAISKHAIQLHVAGTIQDPKVGFPQDGNFLKSLTGSDSAGNEAGDSPQGASVPDLLSDLLDAARGEDGQIETPLLDRFRERRRGDSQNSDSTSEEADAPRRRGIFRRKS